MSRIENPIKTTFLDAGFDTVESTIRAKSVEKGEHPDVETLSVIRENLGGEYGDYVVDGHDLNWVALNNSINDPQVRPLELNTKLYTADVERIANNEVLDRVRKRLAEISLAEAEVEKRRTRMQRILGKGSLDSFEEKWILQKREDAIQKRLDYLPDEAYNNRLSKKLLDTYGEQMYDSAVKEAESEGIEIRRTDKNT